MTATAKPTTPAALYPGAAAAARGLTPAGQAGNYPVLLVDGVVGGVWHQRRSGRKLAITVEPLRELTAPQRRQVNDEAGLVGAVMEATATLTVGTATAWAPTRARSSGWQRGEPEDFWRSSGRLLAFLPGLSSLCRCPGRRRSLRYVHHAEPHR